MLPTVTIISAEQINLMIGFECMARKVEMSNTDIALHIYA